jgi:ATP-dependent Clp protease protease subunit
VPPPDGEYLVANTRNSHRRDSIGYRMAALDAVNSAGKSKSVEISIYESIGQNWWGDGLTAKRFERDLKSFGEVANITLRINSGGGSVFEGNAIYNILRAHSASVHTIVDGVAASIASIIALAGDTIEMPENAMMMIHNPLNCICGNADALRKMAKDLDTIKDSIVNVYESRTGLARDKISTMMDEETWMTADKAVELGFADTVTKAVKAVASISEAAAAMYLHPPSHLLQTVPSNVTSEIMEDDNMSANPTIAQPAGQTINMSQADLDKIVANASQAAATAAVEAAMKNTIAPQLQKMNEDRLTNIRMRFANKVSEGKITPAQSKLMASISEQLMTSDAQMKYSTAEDGSNEVTGSPIDALFALVDTMNHGLLQETVAAGDKGGGEGQTTTATSGTVVATSAKNWKPDMGKIPDEQQGCKSGAIMDQYIREVVMKANPNMKYAEAAMLAEKDEDLAKILNDNGYIPANS